MENNNTEITRADYTRFWQDNIQKLEEISANLDMLVNNLEIEYSRFEEMYSRIETDIEILASIYSSINSLKGHEYVLKLNAVIKEYRRRYTRDGIDFNLISFLITRINELRDESISYFPGLEHEERSPGHGETDQRERSKLLGRPYKWITFERNGSWFMTAFNDISILNSGSGEIYVKLEKDIFRLSVNGINYEGLDIFAEFYENAPPPSQFLLLDGSSRVYAASHIGKKIFAAMDFITSKITPFQQVHDTPLASGRVKIFGKNHIYLKKTPRD